MSSKFEKLTLIKIKNMFSIFEKIQKNSVTPQIRDVTGQRQTYTYASEAFTY